MGGQTPVRHVLALLLLLGPAATLSACDSQQPVTAYSRACDDVARLPVLMVHGSGLSAASFAEMRDALLDSGYPPDKLVAINLQPDNGDNIAAARQISHAVERLLLTGEREGLSRVVLISHSMGAVSSRWYAAHMHPERVAALLSVAGANHGSNALCGLAGVGNEQLCPAFAASPDESRLQLALNGSARAPLDETPYGRGDDRAAVPRVLPDAERQITYLTISLPRDEWIDPAASAFLDGAGGVELPAPAFPKLDEYSPGNYLLQDSVAHDDLPSHPTVLRAAEWLLTAENCRAQR